MAPNNTVLAIRVLFLRREDFGVGIPSHNLYYCNHGQYRITGSVASLCTVGTALFVTGSSFADDNGAVFTCQLSADHRYEVLLCFLHYFLSASSWVKKVEGQEVAVF